MLTELMMNLFIMPVVVHECLLNRRQCNSNMVANAVCRRALQQEMAIFKVFAAIVSIVH